MKSVHLWKNKSTVGRPYPRVLNPCIQPTEDQKKKKKKKFYKVPKKQICCMPSNYLYSIYIVFTTIYIVLNIVLGIISNLEII